MPDEESGEGDGDGDGDGDEVGTGMSGGDVPWTRDAPSVGAYAAVGAAVLEEQGSEALFDLGWALREVTQADGPCAR